MQLKSLMRRPTEFPEPFTTFPRSMNEMFEQFFHGVPALREDFGLEAVFPRLDLVEEEKTYVVTAELPGLDLHDVEVTVSGDVLTINGEKKQEFEEKKRNYYRSERTFGTFNRVLTLPAEIDPERVLATFKNGVLTVTLNKTPEAQRATRKITVKEA